MELGLVTYNLARDWDLPTLLERCEQTGFRAVELRTTHAHGVEPTLDAVGRERVRAAFSESPVRLLSFGTTCEFHSPDPEVVRGQVEECREWVALARDLGARGVKVRPNAFPEGEPEERTLARIGAALRECGEAAAAAGVEIWLEVHGRGTSDLRHIRTMLDAADHPSVLACWNSNQTDLDEAGSIRAGFAQVAERIGSVHINELYRADYPYRDLFALLRESGYRGYCLAELSRPSADPVTVMHYYRALFEALSRP